MIFQQDVQLFDIKLIEFATLFGHYSKLQVQL